MCIVCLNTYRLPLPVCFATGYVVIYLKKLVLVGVFFLDMLKNGVNAEEISGQDAHGYTKIDEIPGMERQDFPDAI